MKHLPLSPRLILAVALSSGGLLGVFLSLQSGSTPYVGIILVFLGGYLIFAILKK